MNNIRKSRSVEQLISLDVDDIYENVNVFTVHKSCNDLMNMAGQPKNPIPTPRFLLNSEMLDPERYNKTGAIRKTNASSSNSNLSIQNKPNNFIREHSELIVRRSSNIFNSFKKILLPKKQQKPKEVEFVLCVSPPDVVAIPEFQFNQTLSRPRISKIFDSIIQEDHALYDVPKLPIRPVGDPPSYDDAMKEWSSQNQCTEILETSSFYENWNKNVMKPNFGKIYFD